MTYQITTADNRSITFSGTAAVSIDFNLAMSTMIINGKMAFFASIGYQATYALSFLTDVMLSSVEAEAIRECIHMVCHWPLEQQASQDELICNSCYDSHLNMDLIILNAHLPEDYIGYKLTDIQSERVNVLPPNIFTSTEKQELDVISLPDALKKMKGEHNGWDKLADFVIQNYQDHLAAWEIDPLDKQRIITHLQKILQEPRVKSAFQFDGDNLIACCFNLITPDEKLQFPYFLVVAESHRNKGAAQKLLSTILYPDASSVFYSSNPVVIGKCQTVYANSSEDSHAQSYLLPINAPADLLQPLPSITTKAAGTRYGQLFNIVSPSSDASTSEFNTLHQ